MSSKLDTVIPPSSEEAEARLLWERGRIGARVVLLAIFGFFIGEITLRPLQRPGIHLAQFLNFAVVLACLMLGGHSRSVTFNRVVCLIGFSATAIASGAVGIFANDPTSTLVVLNSLTLGTAILIPWGFATQAAAVAVSVAAATWSFMTTRPYSIEEWLQPVALVLPSLIVSIVVAYLLQRQRRMIADAERHRLVREQGLREANERLETEIRDHEETEGALKFALMELDHRVKNTLATLESVADQTLQTSASPAQFANSFRGRIRAMARIHTGLAARRWEGLDLRELIDLVVGPYRLDNHSVSLRCDGASLSAEEVRSLGTALHELATNAAKYGALSSKEGRVDITAAVSGGDERRMHLVWAESGGPKVDRPGHHGLGTKLIEAALGYESGGNVQLSFEESGVRCEIDIPLHKPSAVEPPSSSP